MLLHILLGAFIVFLFICITLLVAPFSFLLHLKRVSRLESARAELFWLHPWVLSGTFDLRNKTIDIRIFGRGFVRPGTGERKAPDRASGSKIDVPAIPLHREAGSLRHEPDEDSAYETAKSGYRAEQRSSPGPGPEEPNAVPVDHPEKKKEGFFARLRLMREKIRNSPLQKVLFFLRQEKWRHKILSWLARTVSPLFHLLVLHRLSVRARVGIPEPSVTGRLYGYWAGISHALTTGIRSRSDIVFEPVFDRECLEIEANLSIRTSLFRAMAPVVVMILTFPYFSTFMVWRASRKMGFKGKKE